MCRLCTHGQQKRRSWLGGLAETTYQRANGLANTHCHMFNLTHLHRAHPVIMISEYLWLHNLSVDMEWSNGAWLHDNYHNHANVFKSDPQKKPSLQVIENSWYDPQGINRVDVLPKDMRVKGNWSEEMRDPNNGQGGKLGNKFRGHGSELLAFQYDVYTQSLCCLGRKCVPFCKQA